MAAQDAELKLKVSLDLAFFRQQLTGLGQAATGYNVPVQVQFKKESIVSQFRLLSSYLGRKTFDVKITSRTLEGLAGKVETLHGQLKALKDEKIDLDVNINASVPKFGRDQAKKIRAQIRRDILSEGGQIPLDTKLNLPNVSTFVKNLSKQAQIVVGLKNGATGKEVQNVLDAIQGRIKANQKIKQGGGKLRVPVSVKPEINNEDIAAFKAAVQSKLGGITVKIKAELEGGFAAGKTGLAGLQEYMRTQGLSGGNMPGGVEIGRRTQFESLIGSASHADLKRYMKIAEIAGRSALTTKEQMREALLKANDIAMENILGNMKMQMRDPLPIKRGFLDQVARAVFWMAGVDPEYLKQQAAQRKALPAVNFPASVPVQNLSVGPSSTGRALPPGAIPSALPGTAFAGQKFLPTGLGEETKKVLRDAANAFLDAIRQGIREVKVQDMGNAVLRQPLLSGRLPAGLLPGRTAQANVLELNNILAGAIREYFKAVAKEVAGGPRAAVSRQPLFGPGSQVAGLLPAAGGTTPRGQMRFNAVSGGAVLGQPQFMRAPSIPAPIGGGGGGMQPPGGGGGGGMGGFGRGMGNVNLPGANTIRELGSEFGNATKQVLLFGTAYKALAFLTSFPMQVGQAVGALQSFNNTLKAVSPTAQEAKASNDLILSLVEKYNVPLQSARDGFTKLYASMAPAGFKGEDIRNIFTGISKATAAFGLSADKVDRVNYAFAQMASKGQVMSEELKGQLGDVLPGAMAIFAEAAGFKGPDAIQKFSKALEDGAYKGEAMKVLLQNVGVVMNKEFGPGAEGAARTFQGAMNRIQNSMTLLYESFEPVAVGFLNSVVTPLTAGVKTLTDGFNSFFTQTAAKTSGGFALAQQLEKLRPAFEGIKQNVVSVIATLGQMAKVGLELGKILLQIAGSPLVGYLARVYAIILPLNIALGVMRGLWASNAIQLLVFQARIMAGTSTLSAFRSMMQTTGMTATATGAAIRGAFASTVIGAVLVGIGLLIEKFMSMNAALEETKSKALGAAQAIRAMSSAEARTSEQKTASVIRDLQRLQASKEDLLLGKEKVVTVPGDMASRFRQAGVPVKQDLLGRNILERSMIPSYLQQQEQIKSEAKFRQQQVKFDEQQARTPAALQTIPAVAGEASSGRKGEKLDQYNRSQLQFIEDQFQIEKQRLDKQLQAQMISQTQYDISIAELELETEKLKIAEQYRLEKEKTNRDNLSAADKALKLKDLEINKNNALKIAEDKRNIAVGAARQKIIKPIIDDIDKETLGIERQTMQLEALKQGRLELSSTQEAELTVKSQYIDLATDERKIAKGELDLLTQIIAQRLENVKLLERQTALTEAQIGLQATGAGLRTGFFGSAAGVFERALSQSNGDVDFATKLANIETQAMKLRSVFEGMQSAIGGVSDAFGTLLTDGIANMVSGTATAKEVFADFLKSVSQALLQAAGQMISTYIAIGIAKIFAGLGGGGGGGNPAGSGGGISNLDWGSINTYGVGLQGFANGGVAKGGFVPFRAFANGGTVSGPTLGLIGEGKYNEAVVPLPDGKSIPVNLGSSSRDLLNSTNKQSSSSPMLNMSFQSTTINGVEYVDRAQLEAAMAETRRLATRDGANRGSQLALGKLKNSPNTRRQIGLR